MKMTPEQKVFYEYGETVEVLKATINQIRLNAFHEFGEPYHLLMKNEQKCLINGIGLASKIHDVRQKRAVCRSWVPLERRRCKTCRYRDESPDFETCDNCTQGIFINDFCNWEPRKEGE